MKILLVAINARYSHSSLAIHTLCAYSVVRGQSVTPMEFTINNTEDFILAELYKQQPDAVGFSCYIWNIEMIRSIVTSLKKILPCVKIILGGPEATYRADQLYAELPCDLVVRGEGEEQFYRFVRCLEENHETACAISRQVDLTEYVEMDTVPFAYDGILPWPENKAIYYESSRGCPFSCQYCLSSAEKGVRFRSLSLVMPELLFFLRQKAERIKFVDRTFNCNKAHAMAIWSFLARHDNGVTNFHFEIAADLLDDDMLALLQTIRPGQFQFEIGVQSTNETVLAIINRQTRLEMVFQNVRRLNNFGNIHLHLDLIAGLPEEGLKSFRKSFNDVYSLAPQQLQLGFLKVLPGSGMVALAETYGIKYRETAPYEVLQTGALSYDELQRLKGVEEMTELYYNSGRFTAVLRYAVELYDNAFDMYSQMWGFWEKGRYHLAPLKKLEQYTVLYHFFISADCNNQEILRELLMFDLYASDHVKNPPEWVGDMSGEAWIPEFYNSGGVTEYCPHLAELSVKQQRRVTQIIKFSYDIPSWLDTETDTGKEPDMKETSVIFDYNYIKGMKYGYQCINMNFRSEQNGC